ncbi:MAG: type VI secretion system baseplate subunit TssE [Planctomycetes bacterium]|nr:type VI secretion system baseplate subunit TssE [Planctomycetota bacterium]
MSPVKRDQPLVPSLLDRLLDNEPDNPREPAKQRFQVLRELKQSVQRDLENLLNTRWRCSQWPPDLDQLDTSLINYGIPDFSGVRFASPNAQEELRRVLERVVQTFEPRFKDVRVVIIENSDPTDRTMRFRIEALLRVEPEPEPVVFDTILETAKGEFDVKEAHV